jgi:tripartite-type tricarboxylate transporter receptor subunit TctC
MSGELFNTMAGVSMAHVPYRSLVQALTDLIGGQVEVIFSTMPPAIEYVRAGKLHALGVTATMRSEALPDVPIIAEFLPGYESSLFSGLGAPKKTPVEIIDKLNSSRVPSSSPSFCEFRPSLPVLNP